ncbi:MAG: iron complex outerrane recepter protein [Blastocatellia bacterium]|nr:iron complex outerrane recepter protein [Blastocatellia bacterium]
MKEFPLVSRRRIISKKTLIGLVSWWSLFVSVSFAQQPLRKLSGIVSDPNNAAIANAVVEFSSREPAIHTTTDAQGNFAFSTADLEGTLLISARGFSATRIQISARSTETTFHIHLQPSSLIERIEVSINAERIPATPTSQFALSHEKVAVSGALTLDDVLRQVPGFSLFRRSGSLATNPTAQGVSLRGIGANGASRALVLLDGVPLNSPFGGWVYWNRVPRVSVESIELLNGATSDIYGSGALGGTINILSRTPAISFLEVETSFGNESTPMLSVNAAKQIGRWGITASGQALRTEGYVIVPKNQRGTIDTAAGTSNITGSITLVRSLSRSGRMFLRLASFGESRRNGTPLQLNDTRIAAIDFGADWSSQNAGDASLRLYGSRENFNQNFSAVSPDRNSETLTNRQRNPSQQVGLVFQWRRAIGKRQSVSGGVEERDVRGHSAEITFSNARITAYVDAGGRQRTVGIFAQDSLHEGNWQFNFGGRIDRWLNSDGFANRTPTTGSPSFLSFREQSETAFSPRFSLLRRFEKGISVGISLYRAFRAPTLNELYRNFRVGNVVTNANASLRAERLTGGETGMSMQMFQDRLTVRGNFFWSEINDSIANVTVSNTAALITRQRQNLGAIRARGAEVSATMKFSNHWEGSGEYLLTDSTVLRFPASRILEGLKVPQVSRNQFNFQVTYSNENWTAGAQGRFIGKQFDDDQNNLPLKRFFTLDVQASRSISAKLRLFIAAQNLTGSRYQISSTPVFTIGPPRLIRAGARVILH